MPADDIETTPLIVEEGGEHEFDFSKYGWFATFRRSKAAVMCVASIALFTDMLVYGIIVPILPLIVQERLGMDSTSTGLLFGCYALGLLVSTPICAILSDRYHTRKIPMMVGMAGLSICTLLFGIANTYWQLMLARIAQGASGGASWTVTLAMLADRFGTGPKLGVVMGTVLSANTFGFIAGPVIGGALYQYWGYSSPFIFCSILGTIGFLAACTIVDPIKLKEWDLAISRRNGNTDDPPDYSEVDNNNPLSIWSLIKDWEIVSICMTLTIVASAFSAIEPILPIYLRQQFDANPSEIGLVYISVVIPTFVSPIVGWLSYRTGQRLMCGIGVVWISIALPLIALPDNLWLEVAPLLFFGATYSIISTPSLPLLGERVKEKGGGAYGQVYGLWNMAYSIGMFVGPAIAGLLMEHYGFFGTLCAFSASTLMIAPFVFVGNPFKYIPLKRFRCFKCFNDGYSSIPQRDPDE
ncbi:major facilitator superfamily domain-containing protein [Gigaspora rosea]|uniref:Major facilitator superfamily domain-containing protein n=1 Tax=Gigaspora rosea TaxID=44941 RepID=A0A397U6L8_9GLOM|nr:major facilitator superfamily domain-containing protein [Gigaspora rosea]